ncbi:MAG TPA: hypothetical protein VI341_08240 [Actinomycetota bacterium]
MSDFLLLYQGGGAMPDSEEAQKQVMDAWTSWFTGLGAAVKDPGNPFSGAASSIASDGAVSEGGGGTASGYSVITADSLDAAVTLSKDCPVLQSGASITVFETFDVM